MFAFQDVAGRVEVAFTDRHGGTGTGPFASLDLGRRAGNPDEPPGVEDNLAILAHAVARGRESPDDPYALPAGVTAPVLCAMSQVHGADVAVIDAEHLEARPSRAPARPQADALVTTLTGVALLVRVADCVPVLLADPEAGVVGAVHAGRAGLAAGVVPAALATMARAGARHVRGWVGPHVCGACYEVPADLRDEVAAVVPEARSETSWGTPALDVGAGVLAQLRAEQVEVVDASRCTLEDDDLFSYRRSGPRSGRLGGVVWMRP